MIQEYMEKNLMDKNMFHIAEQIIKIHQKTYEVYLSLVEDV